MQPVVAESAVFSKSQRFVNLGAYLYLLIARRYFICTLDALFCPFGTRNIFMTMFGSSECFSKAFPNRSMVRCSLISPGPAWESHSVERMPKDTGSIFNEFWRCKFDGASEWDLKY